MYHSVLEQSAYECSAPESYMGNPSMQVPRAALLQSRHNPCLNHMA